MRRCELNQSMRSKPMSPPSEVIETTAGQVTAELAQRGIGSDERVIVTIEPVQELIPGRRCSHRRAARRSMEIPCNRTAVFRDQFDV
jgi:hypothetical protein